MFVFRESVGHHDEGAGTGTSDGARVEVAFTDASLDLRGLRPGFADELARLEQATGVGFARLNQVHGDVVVEVDDDPGRGERPVGAVPIGDAMVTARRGLGLMVRVADCVPVVLADPDAGVVAVAHAGRLGVAGGIVPATLAAMRRRGATRVRAWVGPHVCGRCYEVPEALRAEVAALVPGTVAETSWGTPSLDLGAGVADQLDAAEGLQVEAVTVGGCTREDDRLHSHRRDGDASGRLAGLVWMP